LKATATLIPAYLLLVGLVTYLGCSGGGGPVIPASEFATLTIRSTETVASPPDYSYDSKVTVSPVDGAVFCCYVRKVGEKPEVLWRHGQPGTLSVEEPITDVDDVRSFNPALMASPKGEVYFVWQNRITPGEDDKEIFARIWSNGAWSAATQLTITDIYTGWDPDIALYPDGRPVVCWFDHMFGIHHEILCSVGDGSGGWSAFNRLTNDDHWQYYPRIDIDSTGILHLVYFDTRWIPDEKYDLDHLRDGTNVEIYYRNWDGITPGPEIRITNTQFRSLTPHIAVDSVDNPHIIWVDETELGYFRLYHRSVNGGAAGPITSVSAAGRRADQSDICVLGERILIAYPEFHDPVGPAYGDSSLYVREILPDGRMGDPVAVATSGANMHPWIAADPGRNSIWVIWTEYTGDDELLITGESRIRLSRIEID
jgi:hypothetical protein